MILFLLTFCITLFIDQVSKFFIENNLYRKSIDIIDGIFSFTYVQNKGAAWGVFSEHNWILTIFIPLFIGGLIYFLYKTANTKTEYICYGLIIGGGIGNYIDRIFRGYVVDFFDFKIWPVFNFADICIVIGCILFITNLIIAKERN